MMSPAKTMFLPKQQRERLDLHLLGLAASPALQAHDEHHERADDADEQRHPVDARPFRQHRGTAPMSVMSGRKPDAMFWNSFANGPTNWPSSMLPVRPRKISMPPSVTMKEGIVRIGHEIALRRADQRARDAGRR